VISTPRHFDDLSTTCEPLSRSFWTRRLMSHATSFDSGWETENPVPQEFGLRAFKLQKFSRCRSGVQLRRTRTTGSGIWVRSRFSLSTSLVERLQSVFTAGYELGTIHRLPPRGLQQFRLLRLDSVPSWAWTRRKCLSDRRGDSVLFHSRSRLTMGLGRVAIALTRRLWEPQLSSHPSTSWVVARSGLNLLSLSLHYW
jgi:hypothetical protein